MKRWLRSLPMDVRRSNLEQQFGLILPEQSLILSDDAESELIQPPGLFSVEFDNSTGRITIGPTNVIMQRDSSTPCTIAWWEKVKASGPESPRRFRFPCSVGNAFGIFRSDHASYSNLSTFDGANNMRGTDISSLASTVGTWKHYAVVIEVGPEGAEEQFYRFYEDGVLKTTATSGGGGFADQTICTIGSDGSVAANCLMTDVRVYHADLSTGDIQDIYNNDSPRTDYANYWDFSEGEGTTVASQGPNTVNDGVLQTGATWSTDLPTQLQ